MSTIDINELEFEIPVSVSYNYTPGRPATGPSFESAGGDPAEPDEFDIDAVNLEIPYTQILKAMENSNKILVKIDISKFLTGEDFRKIEEYYYEQCD